MSMDDADYWFRFMNLDSLQRFLTDRYKKVEHIRHTLSWLISNYDMDIESITRITLAIHPKHDEYHPIGWVSFGPLPEDEELREIAYAVHPEYWGIGIATEASDHRCKDIFFRLGLGDETPYG
jgi:RimJ/RimL family protein N-acetyltransferase